jgi:riboflavin synthase
VRKGASLAVNGCCLTVIGVKRRRDGFLLEFDLLEETWRKTNFQYLVVGRLVNLERPLRAGGELGGHFVTGHIDGLGKIVRWEQVGRDWVLDVSIPKELAKYVVYKGSVAVDGISLTVAEVLQDGFRIWIIPHTYEITALKDRTVGEFVNVECDIIGKYVEKFVVAYTNRV